jgi:parvulin-like peptidyl-prolyl isomerase
MAIVLNKFYKVVFCSLSKRVLVMTYALLLLVSASGCASFHKNSTLMAMVDGEPITIDDLNYSLAIEHRRENLSGADKLDIMSYLETLIGDKLIVQEGFRMEMEKYPEVVRKIEAFVLRESVVRLHKDEILNKVVVSDEDVLEFYKENYERFIVEMIEVDSEELARQLLERLRAGEDFTELASEYSVYEKKDDDELIFRFGTFTQIFRDALAGLGPGEISDVIEQDDSFYIVKLLRREDAPDEEFADVKGRIHAALRKKAEEERSKEYLEELREKADLQIDEEVLSSLGLEVGSSGHEKWADDTRTLLVLDGESLRVKDFIALLPPVIKIPGKEMLDNWINRKLVDKEALSRRYDLKPELSSKLARYREKVIKNVFIKEVILPSIEVSDKLLRAYYDEHPDDYMAPARYRLQVITVESEEEARDIYDSLLKGADFSWLARMRSTDKGTAEKGGDTGFKPLDRLPEPFREIIPALEPGDISPVIELEHRYGIVRLLEKKEETLRSFNSVKPDVYRAFMAEQFREKLNDYIEKLKASSEIIVYEDAVRSFEGIFK